MTLFAPLDDSMSTSWPPVCWYAEHIEDFPDVAEVWERYWRPEERTRVLDRQQSVECKTCGEKTVRRKARDHQRDRHPGEAVSFDYTNPRWTWELMGFADLWDRCEGWRTLIDPRTRANRQWEYDVHELGRDVADDFWSFGVSG